MWQGGGEIKTGFTFFGGLDGTEKQCSGAGCGVKNTQFQNTTRACLWAEHSLVP